jgi:hypothetical protein
MKFLYFKHIPSRSINRAYILAKRIRNLQIHYIWYRGNFPSEAESSKIATYMETILQEYVYTINWLLVEFRITRFLCSLFSDLISKQSNSSLLILGDFNKLFNLPGINKSDTLKFDKQLLWIQASLDDLKPVQQNFFSYLFPLAITNLVSLNSKIVPYESIGLIPRSITRTFGRFQTELGTRSRSIILSEFRLLKYQAIASLQYILYVIVTILAGSQLLKFLILHPFIKAYWYKAQDFLFINTSQEEQALIKLQEIEELVWLELVLDSHAKFSAQNFAVNIHQKTLDLVDFYTQDSIAILLNLLNSFWLIGALIVSLIYGTKRLTILNSWIQEIFYSLSDTMKAFFILLCTDLCIGFHSPHGWEIIIAWSVEHLGFPHNPYIISCIVSTFPVILDTIFKYWIFRHLNRISPSIVVTYHTMNE